MDKSYEEIMAMSIPDTLQETVNLWLQTKLPVTEFPKIDTGKPTLIYNSYNLDALWRKEEEVNKVLLLEPSHFKDYPVSEKVIHFVIDLSKNIAGIQIYTGEIDDFMAVYKNASPGDTCIISKEHPAFEYYPGVKDSRDWMFPQVSGFYPSFFSYWKKCEQQKNHLLR